MKQGKKDGTDISSASFNFLNAKDKKERLNYLQEIGQDIIKSQIKDSQFPQIWKNLFDGLLAISKEKELMEIAEKISQLVTYFEFSDQKLLLKWVHDCFEVFHREWDHVDYALKSSVLYLMWFCFLQVLFFLQLRKFDSKLVKEWNQILVEVMLGTKLQKKATGMVLYTLEMFVLGLLELKNPSHDVLVSLLEPFVDFLAKSNDKALSTRIIENIFHIFLKDMKEGHFANFDTDKYAEHLRKRAGAKDVNESNKKLLEKVQKGFAEGIESDNEEEEGAVQKEGKKKGRKSKAELEAENQKGKKGKAQTKHDKKKAEKNKKNLEEEDDEDDEEDEGSDEEEDDNDGRMEDEDEDEEDENDFDEEEEDPKPKKRNAGKGIQRKGTMGAKKGRKQEEEEEEGEEEDELPEDWEEEIDEDDLSEEGSEEELDDDLEEEAVNGLIAMSDNGRIPPYLLQSAKQQQIYFNKLNKEYYDNLKKAAKKAIAHKRKVNFQLKKNTVKEFNKKNKVDNKKNGNDRPSSLNKSILKKQSFGENLIKSAKGKKGAKKKVKI